MTYPNRDVLIIILVLCFLNTFIVFGYNNYIKSVKDLIISKWFLQICEAGLVYLNKSSEIVVETFDINKYLNLFSQKLSFDKFNGLYKKKYNTTIDPNWLGWFVGFAEGDGYIGAGKSLSFVLTQKESKILYEIRDTFKFGTVQNFSGFSRYVVRDLDSIILLFHLFNGNLHFVHRVGQLTEWANWLNNKYKNIQFNVITKLAQLIFNDSWLSGFLDAEGCFNIFIPKNSSYVYLRFILDQKNAELFFKFLKYKLGVGTIYSRKNDNVRFSVTNLSSLMTLNNYLAQFPLKSKKQLAYAKWLTIYNMVIKEEHKTQEGFSKIEMLSKQINLDND